jgi:protein arginine kinase activator
MTCEICGKNATFFFKQTKNGYTVEKALCSECANKSGLSNPSSLFDAIQDDFFGGLLTSFVNKEPKLVSTKSCSGCGMTLGELLNGGKVGCAKCYTVFEKSLVPTIAKIHGNVVHCGKFPEAQTAEDLNYNEKGQSEPEKAPTSEKEQIELLKKQLKIAVDDQEYELAAKLRDEIKSLEEKLSQNENEEGGEK